MESGEDPTTQELRLDQLRREQAEQDNAGDAPTEDAAEQHERRAEKASYLREQLEIATRTGVRPLLLAGLDCCGHLCVATRRHAEAVTVWAARSALGGPGPLPFPPLNVGRRDDLLRKARDLLG